MSGTLRKKHFLFFLELLNIHALIRSAVFCHTSSCSFATVTVLLFFFFENMLIFCIYGH